MKKLCAVCLSIFSLISVSQAQNTTLGIKAGYSSSSVQVDGAPDWESRSGFHAGVLAHIHITSHFAVQPELIYSRHQGGERVNEKLKLSYLNIPVLLQYMINDGFRLQTGPQVGFLVSSTRTVGTNETDVETLVKSTDISWVFGASYVFSSGFGIDARYNLGLNNISDENNIEAKNRVFQAGLFYQFHNKPVKKK